MARTQPLRESVSNWIVSGTAEEDLMADTTTKNMPPPAQVTQTQEVSLDSFFTPSDKASIGDMLGKRSFPFTVPISPSVAPAKIFQDVFNVIQSYNQPPAKRSRLCDSTDFLSFPEETYSIPIPSTENSQESDDELNESTLSLSQSQESDIEEDEEYVEEKIKVESSTVLPPPEELLSTGTKVSTSVSFSKRGNGNQPWSHSCTAPPKIGKMRKLTIALESSSDSPHPVQVQVRTEDLQPDMHKGNLVLCRGDRCCVKTKQSGSKKAAFHCTDRLSELTLPRTMISSSHPCEFEIFLKPEWNGLGKNNTRPNFDVIVELIDCSNDSTHELLCWETELQSHKFESSNKARAMEKDCATRPSKSIVNL